MPRQSTASLSVVPVTALERLPAPSDLSESERAIWLEVIDSKPADWFGPDSAPLLKEYVRAVVMCDWLGSQIDVAITGGQAPDRLMKLRDMESKRLLSIGTKLRLTQQSRYTPRAASLANSKAGAARPWQHANNAK